MIVKHTADTFPETKQSRQCGLQELAKRVGNICLANHKSVHYREASEICYTALCGFIKHAESFGGLLRRTFLQSVQIYTIIYSRLQWKLHQNKHRHTHTHTKHTPHKDTHTNTQHHNKTQTKHHTPHTHTHTHTHKTHTHTHHTPHTHTTTHTHTTPTQQTHTPHTHTHTHTTHNKA